MSDTELKEAPPPTAAEDFEQGLGALTSAAEQAKTRLAAVAPPEEKPPARAAQILTTRGISEPTPEEANRTREVIRLETARKTRLQIRERLREIPEAYLFARFGKDERWLTEGVFAKRPGAVKRSRAIGLSIDPTTSVAWSGPSGTGKSSLAAATLALYIEQHPDHHVMFVSSYKLARARSLLPFGQGEAPLVERAQDVDLLVLDDLGSEPTVSLSAVPDVIHDRAERALPTWVTTWCTKDELSARYGNGIARRLLERAVVIDFEDG